MVDRECSMDIYKFVKTSIGTVMKNPEMLKFIPEHLKTKKLCKHAFKKLSFLIRYVLDQYKTQQICDKAILEMVEHQSLFLTALKIKNCGIKLLTITLMH